MGGDAEAWYELRPDGAAVEDAERYRERAAAEQAATAMLNRRPGLQAVEIVRCDAGGQSVVGRISPSQPPAPAEAEIDALHTLPRGAPEQ